MMILKVHSCLFTYYMQNVAYLMHRVVSYYQQIAYPTWAVRLYHRQWWLMTSVASRSIRWHRMTSANHVRVDNSRTIGELPTLCVKIRPDSWLVCGPFRCHREWCHEWQHGGLCPCRRSFGCVLLLDQIFRKQCTVRQYTTLIYLISLLGKLCQDYG